MTDWIIHSELSDMVLIPLHVELLFLPTTLQHVDIWSTKIPILGCAYNTAGLDKVHDQRKRILCTLDETGKTMTIESSKVDFRRPLTAVTEITECGRWVWFGPQS